jgi:hypothetical protein
MDSGVAAIIVGSITAVGGIIVAFIQAARKENHQDHAKVESSLFQIGAAIGRVDSKLDRHIEDHEKGTWNGKSAG